MQLNGEQRKLFHKSLLNAFPSKSKLEQMVSFELDQNLSAIAMGENYSEIVFKLIIWAEAEGKVEKLLTAARESNSGNLELESFEAQMRFDDQNPQSVIPENPKIQENDLSSEKGVDYTRLRDLLKTGKWKEADNETLTVMLKAADREKHYLIYHDIEKFPCTDLRTIDQLWVKYSEGRFGFSVQKRIWESVGRDYGEFGDRVGWRKETILKEEGMLWWYKEERKKKKWLANSELNFSDKAQSGHLPHLGGGGGSVLVVRVAVFFSRVQTCEV